ncbi:MAG: TonB-dependent receptor, partial [Tannerellaceae bacterium]|nr:TonB-dependent receptor [Tannerellaceae bacterium]
MNIKYKTDKTVFSYSNGTNFSVTEYKFGNINSKQKERQFYNSIDVKHFINESVYIQTGISSDYNKMDFSNQFPYFYYAVSPNDSSYKFDNKISNHNLEAFLYGRWKISQKITFGGGIRKNIPTSTGENNFLSFQSSLRYSINNKHSILLSGGKYSGYS